MAFAALGSQQHVRLVSGDQDLESPTINTPCRGVLTPYLGTDSKMTTMQIGELAKRGGVGVETVRFYERKGLLLPPARKPSGYRVYGDHDLKRLVFIRQAKVLGFSLQDIREIIAARGKGQCPCGTVIGIAERHLRETEQQIRSLTAFRTELRRAVSRWKREGQQQVAADAICTLIERTIERRLIGQRRGPIKKNR